MRRAPRFMPLSLPLPLPLTLQWRVGLWLLICAAMTILTPNAYAHEVRPAFLNIDETAPSEFSVLWKQPVVDGRRLKIKPIFPNDCEASAAVLSRSGNTVSERWTLNCGLRAGQIRLDGLERTLTDVFTQINYQNEAGISALIKPENPVLTLGGPKASAAWQYLWIGTEHILFGWDHLLFVIGLTMLVARRQILGVATAFTLAHSITLAMAALGGLSLPSRPVEILIAASIVLLAVEILRKQAGRPSLGARRPYLISFIIGLIHGCGFAGALADIGLPKGTEILALLLFNIGVELGQFAVIALAVLAFFALGRASKSALHKTQWAGTYAIAAVAMFWMIQRLAGYVV